MFKSMHEKAQATQQQALQATQAQAQQQTSSAQVAKKPQAPKSVSTVSAPKTKPKPEFKTKELTLLNVTCDAFVELMVENAQLSRIGRKLKK